MIVSYKSYTEILVCSADQEHELIKDYFVDADRDLEDYDREEHKEVLEITSQLRSW